MLKRFIVILLFASVSVTALLCVERKEIRIEEEEEIVEEVVLSEYDDIMKAVEEESGIDWRLLSAIAYAESRFSSDLVSKRGAVGVMQVMPSIGRYFGFSAEELPEPQNNIRAAAFLLCDIESAIRLPHEMPSRDRLAILLACYNGGIGHVSDARRLARAFGEDANSWETVSRYLRLKSDPQYYENEVVKSGRFKSGRGTTAYVRDVLKRYDHYCKLTGRPANKPAENQAGEHYSDETLPIVVQPMEFISRYFF